MIQALTQSPWVERTGWVLVHSLWQFAVVAILAVMLQWALRRRSAALSKARSPGVTVARPPHCTRTGDLEPGWPPVFDADRSASWAIVALVKGAAKRRNGRFAR